MSELKVLISDMMSFAADGISVAVVLQHNHNERQVMRITDEGFTVWEDVNGLIGTKPTITLPNDAARALLESLLRWYQGSEDMRTTRADLLHERGRVDRLITAVIDLGDKALDSALGN